MKKPAKTREELETAITLEMEDICEAYGPGHLCRAPRRLRGFLIERGIIVRQGVVPLRKALPDILSSNTNILSPRMVSFIADLMQDWRRLDERIDIPTR